MLLLLSKWSAFACGDGDFQILWAVLFCFVVAIAFEFCSLLSLIVNTFHFSECFICISSVWCFLSWLPFPSLQWPFQPLQFLPILVRIYLFISCLAVLMEQIILLFFGFYNSPSKLPLEVKFLVVVLDSELNLSSKGLKKIKLAVCFSNKNSTEC